MVTLESISDISKLETAQLHRETYISVLTGIFPTRRAQGQFAQSIGISPRHFSLLMHPLADLAPTRDIAQRIADHTPLPVQSKHELLHHLRESDPQAPETTSNAGPLSKPLTPEQVRDVILMISNYEHHAMFSTDPITVRSTYMLMLKLSHWILLKLDPAQYPQHMVGICASLSGTASILNMPVKSMWFAQQGLAIARNPHLWQSDEMRLHHDSVLISAWDRVATSWHNLGRPRKALECVMQAKQIALSLPEMAERNRWLPGVIMEELNSYAIHPAFSIVAAEKAKDQGLNGLYGTMEQRSSVDVVASLIERNMIESYIQHGSSRSLKIAEHYITDNFSDDRLSSYGPLIHTMHLRTCVKFHRKTGNQTTYQHYLHHAYELSQQAGLIHQQTEIHREMYPAGV